MAKKTAQNDRYDVGRPRLQVAMHRQCIITLHHYVIMCLWCSCGQLV